MGDNEGPVPEHLTFSEAVKLAKTKPERKLERNDLLVRDKILEPHWHWSRDLGYSRDDAVERARTVFYEEVILVGKEAKVKKEKRKKGEQPAVAPESQAPTISAPRTVEPVVPLAAQTSTMGSVAKTLPFAEVVLATMSIVLYFFIRYTTMELLILLVANLALTLASLAGLLFARPRGSAQPTALDGQMQPPK